MRGSGWLRVFGAVLVAVSALTLSGAMAGPPLTPIAADALADLYEEAPGVEWVAHATPGATCGMSSGNTARTCSSHSINSCKRAVARGVAGFTAARCQKLETGCSSCLASMQRCVRRIGHISGRLTNSTCETCKSRLYRCLDQRTPVAG